MSKKNQPFLMIFFLFGCGTLLASCQTVNEPRPTDSPTLVAASTTTLPMATVMLTAAATSTPLPRRTVPGLAPHRGRELLRLAHQANPNAPALALAHTIRDTTFSLLGQHATLDFGLVTLCQVLNLPPGAAITLFALGRTVGWIGHALEQYARDELIRPRARYVGRQPFSQVASQPVSR